jgi:hypothetical protein
MSSLISMIQGGGARQRILKISARTIVSLPKPKIGQQHNQYTHPRNLDRLRFAVNCPFSQISTIAKLTRK